MCVHGHHVKMVRDVSNMLEDIPVTVLRDTRGLAVKRVCMLASIHDMLSSLYDILFLKYIIPFQYTRIAVFLNTSNNSLDEQSLSFWSSFR